MRRAPRSALKPGASALAVLGAAACLAIASGALAAGAPPASTGAASEATDTSATLTGSVIPNGQATSYAFEYGTSTHYTQQTSVQQAGTGKATVAVSAKLQGLQPGTTYHYRLIAANASGASAGKDLTFKTTGLAPPQTPTPVSTAAAVGTDPHDALLSGTVGPSAAPVSYYFQIGTRQPYDLRTAAQALPASKAAVAVQAPVGGLQDDRIYHYRLVVVGEDGQVSAGADRTFATARAHRLVPQALESSASPGFQRRLPDTVTVSGKLVPPAGLNGARACEGFVDITFRVHRIAMQMLRAGLHRDCTFKLPVRFSSRRRLLGGHVRVHVLFPGNQVLHRLAAPVQSIQVG